MRQDHGELLVRGKINDVSAPTLERLYCPLVEEVGKPGIFLLFLTIILVLLAAAVKPFRLQMLPD